MSLADDPIANFIHSAVNAIVPFALTLLCILLSGTSTPITPELPLKTPFFMIAVYYWSLFRPTMMPTWLAFAGGLCIDALTMMPLGLSALLLTALRKFMTLQRTYIINQPFWIIWGIFALFYAMSISLISLFQTGNLLILLSNSAISGAFILNICMVPFIFSVIHFTHMIFQRPELSPLDRKKKNIIIKGKRKAGLSV